MRMVFYDIDSFIRCLPCEAFDDRICRRRLDLGLTQTQMARATGLSKNFKNYEKRGFFDIDAIFEAREEVKNHWEDKIASGTYRPEWLTQKIQDAWEETLKVPKGWLLDKTIPTPTTLLDPFPLYGEPPNPDAPKINIIGNTVADELYIVCVLLSQEYRSGNKTLDPEKLVEKQLRNTNALALRYGIDLSSSLQGIRPNKKTTYADVGKQFGFNAESTRRILAKQLRHARYYEGRFDIPLTMTMIQNGEKPENLGQVTYFGALCFCKEVLLLQGVNPII